MTYRCALIWLLLWPARVAWPCEVTNPPAGTLGVPYYFTTDAFCSAGGACNVSGVSGNIPPGLYASAYNSILELYGTPTLSGTYSFSVSVFSNECGGGEIPLAITIGCVSSPALTILPTGVPDATLGSPYNQTFSATGGTAPYFFDLRQGPLPPGLQLTSSGTLFGTPTLMGVYPITIGAREVPGCGTGARAYVLYVGCGMTIGPPALTSALRGVSYAAVLTTSGGTAPYRYSSSSSLPTGMVLTSWGVLMGRPEVAGSHALDIVVRDANACLGHEDFVLQVEPGSFIVGQALAPPSAPQVRTFRADGTPTGTDFHAYGTSGWGVNVASALLDGNGGASIITGPGPGVVYGPQVRGFRSDGSPLTINFFAFGTLRYGVGVAAGDIDPYSRDELLAGAGPAAVFGPHARGFRHLAGRVTAMPGVNFFAYAGLRYGVNLAAGNVDGDAFDEIVTGPGPSAVNPSEVRGFDYDGSTLAAIPGLDFLLPGISTFGVTVACGDVADYGTDQIAVGPGPSPLLGAIIRGYRLAGGTAASIPGCTAQPFTSIYGARVGAGIGLVAGNPRDQIVAAPGPDPAALAVVVPLDYDSGALRPGQPFYAFQTPYGATVAAGPLVP